MLTILLNKDPKVFPSKRKLFLEEILSPKYLNKAQSKKTMLSRHFSLHILEISSEDGRNRDITDTKVMVLVGSNLMSQLLRILKG